MYAHGDVQPERHAAVLRGRRLLHERLTGERAQRRLLRDIRPDLPEADPNITLDRCSITVDARTGRGGPQRVLIARSLLR
jgi:hypothetical protein